MTEKPWYEAFFEGADYLRSYQEIFAGMDPAREADFLVRELALGPGARVLDLCCGQGRHAVELAKRGARVVGQDLSGHLLERARESAKAAGVELQLVQRDMREIPFEAEFDAAINLFTAFGYFKEDRENFRVLEGISRALKSGGRFCIDLLSFPWLLRNWQQRGWTLGESGLLALDERSMDWMRGIQSGERLLIEPDGTRKRVLFHLRHFAPHELVEWLRRAGLETRALFGDFGGAPFKLDSPRLIAVAEKTAGGAPLAATSSERA